MSRSENGLHILVFPYPAQGHILPILDLVHQLALRGLTITILVTPKNLPILAPLLSSQPSIKTLVFPFPDHPSIPPGVENVKELGNGGNGLIIGALSKLHDEIILWFKSHPSPPIAIISDVFLVWTQDLAYVINVPRIAFYSSGAFLASIFEHLWHNFESISSLNVVNFSDLPRSPTFRKEHLPPLLQGKKESNIGFEVGKKSMVGKALIWGAILNTFDALEHDYLECLKKKTGHECVFSVGPLHLFDGSARISDPNVELNDGVLKWLDGCAEGSVLYVCFGSQKFLKQDQMDALANGLERSGVKFIWVVRPVTAQQGVDGYGLVPDDFEGRVAGRGLVIREWAPQVSILSHRAVSGFLSHCGWNSVLEAIVAGVMILSWPMEADQFINARLLVDYMGVAVRVCEGGNTVPRPAELAQIIAESMSRDIHEKVRAKELREKAFEAVKIGGSSTRDLDDLVRELGQL